MFQTNAKVPRLGHENESNLKCLVATKNKKEEGIQKLRTPSLDFKFWL